mgnify:FL=1
MDKLLVLGGKPIGSTEIVERAKKKGIYTIVADYLQASESPAKLISDEQWDISVDQVDELARKATEEHVNGIVAGVHEFCLRKAIQVCEKCGLPSWCTLEQWDNCSNKKAFKALCEKNGIDVAKTYKLDDEIRYPVIVKPADSDGSRGFSICNNREELEKGVRHALEFSTDYLIEEFIQSEACIIHYTVVNGEVIFSGISDKHSRRLEGGSMVMALQTFPAKDQECYLKDVNEKAIQMFKSIGIKNSPIWIEAFNDGKRFVFNEMALRFGGSMTNYPVMYNTGLDQLNLFIDAALGKTSTETVKWTSLNKNNYAILPIHLKEGKIAKIKGRKELLANLNIEQIVLVHHVGDEIKNWGTAQQVFCYLHMTYRNAEEFSNNIAVIKNTLRAENEQKQNMLYYLMDFENFSI